MNKKQGLDRRMMISKNSILMLVLLVTVFIAVWAWFASGTQEATATGLTVSTKTPATLELALPKEDGSYPTEESAYSASIDFDKQINIKRTMVSDVTSDGLNFIIPTTIQTSGVRIVQKGEKWNRATANEDYIKIPFYVRSQNPNIYVSGSSKLDAILKDESGKTVNESDVKGLSRNGIVGAMRVSIVDMTKDINAKVDYKPVDKDLKFFWLPRPDLYLSTPTDQTWELKTNVTEQTSLADDIKKGDTYIHHFWSIAESDKNAPSGKGVEDLSYPIENKTENWFWVSSYPNNETSETPTLGENRQIGNGQISDDSGNPVDMTMVNINGKDYYLYKFVMNVWVEGTDAEARRALNNGEFKLDINFCAGTE